MRVHVQLPIPVPAFNPAARTRNLVPVQQPRPDTSDQSSSQDHPPPPEVQPGGPTRSRRSRAVWEPATVVAWRYRRLTRPRVGADSIGDGRRLTVPPASSPNAASLRTTYACGRYPGDSESRPSSCRRWPQERGAGLRPARVLEPRLKAAALGILPAHRACRRRSDDAGADGSGVAPLRWTMSALHARPGL
jgi:hypothetical protein